MSCPQAGALEIKTNIQDTNRKSLGAKIMVSEPKGGLLMPFCGLEGPQTGALDPRGPGGGMYMFYGPRV